MSWYCATFESTFVLLMSLFSAYSCYLTGQWQPDAGHQPVQTAGKGRGCVKGWHNHALTTRRYFSVYQAWFNLTNSPNIAIDCKLTDGFSLSKSGSSSSALVDLMGLNASANTAPSSQQTLTQNVGISLLDDELMSLGKHKTAHLARKLKGRLLSLTF